MKRQVLAVVIGSLFALPAFANNEIDAGYPPIPSATGKSTEQVRAELLAAKQSNNWRVDASLGTQNKPSGPVQFAGKSRDEVIAEFAEARRSGEYVVNAELGTTANQL